MDLIVSTTNPILSIGTTRLHCVLYSCCSSASQQLQAEDRLRHILSPILLTSHSNLYFITCLAISMCSWKSTHNSQGKYPLREIIVGGVVLLCQSCTWPIATKCPGTMTQGHLPSRGFTVDHTHELVSISMELYRPQKLHEWRQTSSPRLSRPCLPYDDHLHIPTLHCQALGEKGGKVLLHRFYPFSDHCHRRSVKLIGAQL